MKKGTHHSKETIAKIKEKVNNPELRKKNSEGMKAFWNKIRELRKQK